MPMLANVVLRTQGNDPSRPFRARIPPPLESSFGGVEVLGGVVFDTLDRGSDVCASLLSGSSVASDRRRAALIVRQRRRGLFREVEPVHDSGEREESHLVESQSDLDR
jgi:hypothetical protein